MTSWITLPALGMGEGALLMIATLLGVVLFLSLLRRERPGRGPQSPGPKPLDRQR